MNEQVILSKRNCHRAAQVRLVAAPENGVYEWSFRGVKVREGFMRNEYEHLAKQGEHEVRVRHACAFVVQADGKRELLVVFFHTVDGGQIKGGKGTVAHAHAIFQVIQQRTVPVPQNLTNHHQYALAK